ncbi:MAG: PLP-dependent aminotransferase family protein [Salegentibacter sp.]|uniref:2-aminoadipate transaminase n=1 Tax=Salegentibacter flavus TaxID=287099 RepID=A0A1I4YAY9_9FLAO|nr:MULTISPECIES: PLP-dependent aminotransferase family protein [Salegentibacter]MDR9456960.1 PLP-dependent aminotransferase family protein [Salegentibacter sp.]SFN35234.1 2-aminoadipate transaminase [Salegentibacter flavus]
MYAFSNAVNSMHSEDIKQLMKQASGKSMISFAGGMPNNDLFPLKQIDAIYNSLPEDIKKLCFQYGPTSGYPPLVKSLENYLENKGLAVRNNKILITTGSLQAISIITQEFVNEGDIILTENPSFVGALSVFETFGAEIHSIPIDKDGIDIQALKDKINSLNRTPKFLYVTPNYHNPAGIIYTPKRKKELLEVLAGTGIILLEDDAYSDLYFEVEEKQLTRSMKSFGVKNVEIIYTGSFSKILGPGFRLGYMLSSEEIFEKAESVKQALDACTSNFMQILANEFLAQHKLEPYLEFLRSEYLERKNLLQRHLEAYMPKEITWNEPKGGFYIWLKLPAHIKSTDVFKETVKEGVVFVTGRTFDPASKKDDRLRLSYSNMPKDSIEKGVIILSTAIKKVLENSEVTLK